MDKGPGASRRALTMFEALERSWQRKCPTGVRQWDREGKAGETRASRDTLCIRSESATLWSEGFL